jgi:hypothetical protein
MCLDRGYPIAEVTTAGPLAFTRQGQGQCIRLTRSPCYSPAYQS